MGYERVTTQRTSPDTAPSRRRRIALGCTLIISPLMAGMAAYGGDTHRLASAPFDALGELSFGHSAAALASGVDPDQPLEVSAEPGAGRITDVEAVDSAGRRVAGELSPNGERWLSATPLAADAEYTVRVSTERGGAPGHGVQTFATRPSDAKQLQVDLGPEAGTYGVGQPLTAELNREISTPEERAIVEQALEVRSTPEVEGSWHWVDDSLLHYRPREYWPADAEISVRSHLEGVHIRDGLRGGETEELRMRTGDRIEAIADVEAHTMTVLRNGEELRTVPITTGKEGFRTRGGKKVILGLEDFVRMRSSTLGIPEGSADSYDLPVHWAARITLSGEYVHGAPWSVGSQGSDNVSHGCTGLSTENARWFYDLIKPGDIVEHVNALGEDMAPFGNGFGDWNLSWEEWLAGSALQDEPGRGSAVVDDAAQGPQRPIGGDAPRPSV